MGLGALIDSVADVGGEIDHFLNDHRENEQSETAG
jgi:hypothetical protein